MTTRLSLLFLAACGSTPDSPPDAATTPPMPDAAIPLAPVPDLRFNWVGAFPAYAQFEQINVASVDGGGIELTSTAAIWSPLQLGPGESWDTESFLPTAPIADFKSVAKAGGLPDLDADMLALLAGGGVVTSLVKDTIDNAYGIVVTTDPAVHYSSHATDVDRAGLAAFATSEAQHGFVITAIAGDGTSYHVLSFAPPNETQTYDVVLADITTAMPLEQAANAMAFDGYTITAYGLNGSGAPILAGAKLAGEHPARSALAGDPIDSATPDGYSIVAWSPDQVIFER